MKLLLLPLVTFLSLPLSVFAQDRVYSPLVDLSNAGAGNDVQSFEGYINFLYGMSIAVAALLAVIKIIIAGTKYMLDDLISGKEEAKKDIQGAVLGLLLIISAVIILELINPQLIKKEIKFDQLPERPDLVAPILTQADRQCSQYSASELKTIPHQEGRSCNNILGDGWIFLNPQCCSLNDSSSDCCGYDENILAPPPPNYGTGDFRLEIVEKDTLNECYGDLENLYETLEICTQQQTSALANINMAVTINCEGETINSPRSRYDAITSFPRCGANQAPGSYGDVSTAYTYSEVMNRFDAVGQAAQFQSRCESEPQFGTYSIKNGPTGTFANATATCRVPTVITYSGSKSKGRTADNADCTAQGGEFDWNLTTANYCVIRG